MSSEDYKAPSQNTRDKAIAEITALRLYPEFKVEQITKYHFRVNEKWDIYPTTRRIFMVGRTDNFYGFKTAADLHAKMIKLHAAGTMPSKSFSLKYFVAGKEIETVTTGAWSVCDTAKRRCVGSGQYRAGALRIVENL